MNADGTGLPINLSSIAGLSTAPWSPDGKRLTFAGYGRICVINANASKPTWLAAGASPAWSPNGEKIAYLGVAQEPYVSEEGLDNNTDVYVMNADGTRQTPLADTPVDDGPPVWSPDGEKIAFTALDDVNVKDSKGSGAPTKIASPEAGFESTLAWSPDGSKIAFKATDGVYVAQADSRGLVKLTDNTSRAADFTWSSDGSKIAFIANGNIYVVNPDGTGLTKVANLTDNTLGLIGRLAWSPDGSKLALTAGGHVYVMNPDGTGLTNLMANAVEEQANENRVDVHTIGDNATAGGITYKVTSAERVAELRDPSGLNPSLSGPFIVVKFVLTNNGGETVESFDLDAYLYDSQGRKYEYDTNAVSGPFLPMDKSIFYLNPVTPGHRATIQTAYSVPPNAKGFSLELNSSSFATETVRIKLGF